MATPPKSAEVTPQNVAPQTGSTPTPTQHENDQFVLKVIAGTLPKPFYHAQDGSPIDPSSPDPTAKTTSFP